jgi:hypothetical protein
MSVFTKILEKLGLKKPASTTPQGSTGGTSTANRPTGSIPQTGTPTTTTAPAGPATVSGPGAPKPISEVDVVKQLEQRAKGSGLDWRVSIVDLLKLLDIDSSRESRNELAKELGCPPEYMHDSAKMNTWLHKEVLRRIAQNGGNIPQNLLD